MKLFITTVALLLAQSAAQQAVPPNRQVPILNPDLGIVQGVQVPGTTPVFKPKPIPPNRKTPVISKADIVMAATDKVGILVNTLAHDLAVDLEKLIDNLPAKNQPAQGLTAQDLTALDPTAQDLTSLDPTAQGRAAQDLASQDPPAQDPPAQHHPTQDPQTQRPPTRHQHAHRRVINGQQSVQAALETASGSSESASP